MTMAKQQMDPAKRKAAVLAVMSGKEKAADVARRLGVTERCVDMWVAAARKRLPKASSPPAPQDSEFSMEAEAAPEGAQERRDRALAAAGGLPGAQVTPAELEKAKLEAADADADFVVSCYQDMKNSLGALASPLIGFSLDNPGIRLAFKVGKLPEETLRSNAHLVAPELRAALGGGWFFVWAAIGVDAMVTVLTVWKIVREEKRQERAEAEKRKAAAAPPPPPAAAQGAA